MQFANPNATRRMLPIPPAPTDAPLAPPSTDPLPLPTLAGGDNGITFAPDTQTPETDDTDGEIFTEEMETTPEPEMEIPSDSTPHGECA